MKLKGLTVLFGVTTLVFASTSLYLCFKTLNGRSEPEIDFNDYKQSVFRVEYSAGESKKNVGTCFSIKKAGFLISCFHIFDTANFKLGDLVSLIDASNKGYAGKIIGYDYSKDYAIIKSEELSFCKPIAFAKKTPKSAKVCYQIGNPYNKGLSLSKGTISNPDIEVAHHGLNQSFIQAEIKTYQGCSGGCLLDEKGLCLGMVTFIGATSDNEEIPYFSYSTTVLTLNEAAEKYIL